MSTKNLSSREPPAVEIEDGKTAITVEYGGEKMSLEPGERVSGHIALQMLLQANLLPSLDDSFSPRSSNSSSSTDKTTAAVAGNNYLIPLSPGGGVRAQPDLEVLDHGCALGSCTHILATLHKAGLVPLNQGGKLVLTAVETPDDFLHMEGKTLNDKVKKHEWRNVKVLQGQMNSLPFVGPHFTHILTNLSILFCASDDEPLHEIYRCLLPNGIVAFSSWKSLGWTYAVGHDPGPLGDPLSVFPSNGWRDPDYIRKKLLMHGFTDIQITDFAFTNNATPALFESVVNRTVRHAVGRLWSRENDALVGHDEVDLIAESVLGQHEGRLFSGQMIAWITTARKAPLSR